MALFLKIAAVIFVLVLLAEKPTRPNRAETTFIVGVSLASVALFFLSGLAVGQEQEPFASLVLLMRCLILLFPLFAITLTGLFRKR